MFDFFSAVHTIGIGILLQALPFMLLGSLLSSEGKTRAMDKERKKE